MLFSSVNVGLFFLRPLPPLNALTRINGAKTVVTIVITIATPKTSRPITPLERPIPATIRATSPLGSMPTEILHAPDLLNPVNTAGIPEPISLLITPKTESVIANPIIVINGILDWLVPKVLKSACIPITPKKSGNRKTFICRIGFSIRCLNSVSDKTRPIVYAPIIIARPKPTSAIPATKKAKANVSDTCVPLPLNHKIVLDICFATKLPIIVNPNQKPTPSASCISQTFFIWFLQIFTNSYTLRLQPSITY